MWQIKWELEDLAFRHLQPVLYQRMRAKIAQRRTGRENFIKHVVRQIEDELNRAGIEGEVRRTSQTYLFDLPENAAQEYSL